MNENYIEQLIKQKDTAATIVKKALLAGTSVLMAAACLISPIAVPFFVGKIALDIYLFKFLNLEYEYLLYNGDLDIDKIMGMQRRKRVFEIKAKDIEVLAPTDSIELQQYEQLRAYDCSSNRGNKTYELVANHKGQLVRIVFEPNEAILQIMKMYEPRKVFI